ncbi:MAG: hypothetical protein VX112_04220 [Pseudomonadota bacterium]|nr:hypothetical protein [Pseudomonadota bacterium]
MSERMHEENWVMRYVPCRNTLVRWAKEHNLDIKSDIVQAACITCSQNLSSFHTKQALNKRKLPITHILESENYKNPVYVGEKEIEKDSIVLAKWLMVKDCSDSFDANMEPLEKNFFHKYQTKKYNQARSIVIFNTISTVATALSVFGLVFFNILPLFSTVTIIGIGLAIIALGRGGYYGREMWIARKKQREINKNHADYLEACEKYKDKLSLEEKKQEKALVAIWKKDSPIINTTTQNMLNTNEEIGTSLNNERPESVVKKKETTNGGRRNSKNTVFELENHNPNTSNKPKK